MHRLVSNYSYNTGQSAPVCSKSHRADSRLACASSGEILVATANAIPRGMFSCDGGSVAKIFPELAQVCCSEFWQRRRRTLFLDLSVAVHT